MSTGSYGWRETAAPTLALFTSVGTLLCCALPALLVTLGLGASLAGLIGAFPEIVWLSEYKGFVFAVSGALLVGAAIVHWRARNRPCPADPAQARACARLRRVSLGVLGLAALIWATGFFFAFVAASVLI
ncbi:MAG: hypothetical protein ACKVOP_05960 [Sphingomonadaceae bacterium]